MTLALACILILTVYVVLNRRGQISFEKARQEVERGALVVDVRSVREYASGHIPGTLHVPLDQIQQVMPKQAADKTRVILLHCASGMRSGMARSLLKKMGYTRVFNLGSYRRAERVVTGGK